MTSKTLAQLLSGLDVACSFSHPHTSNDNPFSESQLRTVKYHPSFPERFTTLDEVLEWGRALFPRYNHEHRHSGIAFLTPADVYFDRAEAVLDCRHETRLAAYAEHPERFPNGAPKRQVLPPATYINPPRCAPEAAVTATEAHCGGKLTEQRVVVKTNRSSPAPYRNADV